MSILFNFCLNRCNVMRKRFSLFSRDPDGRSFSNVYVSMYVVDYTKCLHCQQLFCWQTKSVMFCNKTRNIMYLHWYKYCLEEHEWFFGLHCKWLLPWKCFNSIALNKVFGLAWKFRSLITALAFCFAYSYLLCNHLY